MGDALHAFFFQLREATPGMMDATIVQDNAAPHHHHRSSSSSSQPQVAAPVQALLPLESLRWDSVPTVSPSPTYRPNLSWDDRLQQLQQLEESSLKRRNSDETPPRLPQRSFDYQNVAVGGAAA